MALFQFQISKLTLYYYICKGEYTSANVPYLWVPSSAAINTKWQFNYFPFIVFVKPLKGFRAEWETWEVQASR